jgi:hypothetical protein
MAEEHRSGNSVAYKTVLRFAIRQKQKGGLLWSPPFAVSIRLWRLIFTATTRAG